MNKPSAAREHDPILRQAVAWFMEVREPQVSIARITEWQQWLSADPRHHAEYARVESMMCAADAMRAPWPKPHDLATDCYDGKQGIWEWLESGASAPSAAQSSAPTPPSIAAVRTIAWTRFRRWPLWTAGTLAASMLLMFALLTAGYLREINLPGLLTYQQTQTPSGGTLKALLPDGSTVDAGGYTLLRTVYTAGARTVTLKHGEAFFRVAPDASRPFTVRAGSTTITAVGTAFNVRWSGDHVVVAVAEGTVKVSDDRLVLPPSDDRPPLSHSTDQHDSTARLTAGQQLTASLAGATTAITSIDVRTVASWREGRLSYLDEPLAGIIADVNRYTARRIELADPALGELRITGTVLEHNLDGWLLGLEESFHLRVIRHANGSIELQQRDDVAK
ncbi:FecR family protein [Steroidobacter sp.]|uniref:FecR family protein n=1 Tax=Steroidobacter sp. TaxID=1978227 RepID=UPI001A6311CA|nr:FecR domain-containing protein [Steroidobacter sp.]MBL8268726.1 FecR domain-containing protein [Steroidobacter sp.]